MDHWEVSPAVSGRKLVVPTFVDGDEGGGFKEVEACGIRRQNMDAQYIVMRPILDLCKETLHITRMWVVKRWWEKEIMDLVGAWEVTEASEEGLGAENREVEAEGVAGK